uniref:G_PROTEIN_RECEP_F1_2 domain-containing protein n=1 Tax=Macrostomum lignano TaxID=282301 RepID=A0A1I8FPU5_9PLAT
RRRSVQPMPSDTAEFTGNHNSIDERTILKLFGETDFVQLCYSLLASFFSLWPWTYYKILSISRTAIAIRRQQHSQQKAIAAETVSREPAQDHNAGVTTPVHLYASTALPWRSLANISVNNSILRECYTRPEARSARVRRNFAN